MAKGNTARNLFALLVFVVLLIGAAVVGYLKSPNVHNPAILEQAYQAAHDQFNAYQRHAGDPRQNGYLNESLKSYWGLKSEVIEGCPAQKAMEAWNVYSEDATGESVDHQTLLKTQDQAYLQARQQFETIIPDIVSSGEKPLFVLPSVRVTAEAPIMNFIRLRAATQACSAYLDSKAVEGSMADTVALWQSAISIGGKTGQGMTLIHYMIGIATQAILVDSAFRNLGPPCHLTSDQWSGLARTAQQSTLPEESLLQSVQGEYLMGINSLEDVIQGKYLNSGLPIVHPSFVRREERIYKNYMAKVFAHLNNPATVPRPKFEEFTWWRNLLGKSGIVADMLVSNNERAEAQMSLIRGKTTALSVYFGLRAYQSKYGEYPQTLSELQKLDIAPVQGLEWDSPQLHYQAGKKPTFTLDFPPGMLASVSSDNRSPNGCDWVAFTTDSLVINL